MKHLLLLALFFLTMLPEQAQACPGCIGNTPNDNTVFLIITTFVFACYIPMYFLYRVIFKNRNMNNQVPQQKA